MWSCIYSLSASESTSTTTTSTSMSTSGPRPLVPVPRSLPEGEEETGNLLFNVVPIEIQLEVLKYLDPISVRRMRLVNTRWNEGIKNLIPFDYKRATLSDKTAIHVLPFPNMIRTIAVNDLVNRRRLLTAIAPFGVINSAEELIFGQKIDPFIVKKLLKTASEVQRLSLAPLDPRVGEAFLRFPGLFENVTQFQLKLTHATSLPRLKEEEFFLRKLSNWRKFPHLLSYFVDWRPETSTTLHKEEEVLLVHAMYVSLHNFLYTHRATVVRVRWNFANVVVAPQPFLPNYLTNVPDYVRVKKRMTQVALKEVDVQMSDMEGQDYWDLNRTMLQNQFSLTKITFAGCLQHYSSRLVTFHPFNLMMELIDQNHGSLVDLSIDNRIFSFYSIEGCGELRRLVLKGASIVSTAPLAHLQVQYDIEEVSLDFKFVFPPDIVNLMEWFGRLEKLRILDLRLKLRWTTGVEIFPTVPEFHDLLLLRKLTSLHLHYDANTAFNVHVLKGKRREFQRMFGSWKGVQIKEQNSWKDKKFSIHVHIDRSKFKGPPPPEEGEGARVVEV